jgi:CRP-like cAMP-binding protein
MELAQALSRHWLFDGVAPGALERACVGAEQLTAARGETIYTPHRFRRCLGVLLSGQVRVSKENLVVSTLRAGDLFGAAALFTDSPDYATTLTALSDCALVLLPQENVSRLLADSPAFAEHYVRYLSGRIQFLSRRLDAVSADTAEGKLGQYLLTNADETDQVTISATGLSQRLGVGRATLYRAFEALEREGAIRREGKTIRILSREKL